MRKGKSATSESNKNSYAFFDESDDEHNSDKFFAILGDKIQTNWKKSTRVLLQSSKSIGVNVNSTEMNVRASARDMRTKCKRKSIPLFSISSSKLSRFSSQRMKNSWKSKKRSNCSDNFRYP